MDEPIIPAPSWNDLFLRFPDEATANSTLLAAGLLTETQALLDADGNVLQPAGYAARGTIDSIGTIYEPLGAMVDGEDPAPVALPGWHVNVRMAVGEPTPEGLEQYLVTPTNPVRGWL